MRFVNVPGVGLRFAVAAEQAEAQGIAQRAGQAEVGALGGALLLVLRHVEVAVQRAVQRIAGLLGDDVDHAARGAVAVARGGRAAQHFDAFDHFRRHPGGITARVALAAPALTHRVAAGGRFAVDQNQGVFRAHAADIDLAIVAALAAGGVAGQVNPGHGADQFADVARRRAFFDLVGGDGGHPRRLQVLPGGGHDDGVFAARLFIRGAAVFFRGGGVGLLRGVGER